MTIEELYEHVSVPCSFCTYDVSYCKKCGIGKAKALVNAIWDHFEKYRWHDLRKDPEDLPPKEDGYMVKQIDVEQPFSAYWTKGRFVDEYCKELSGIIVAWREIEPFEEVIE